MDKQDAIYYFRELFYSIISENRYLNKEIYIQKQLRNGGVNTGFMMDISNEKMLYESAIQNLEMKRGEFEKLMEDLNLEEE